MRPTSGEYCLNSIQLKTVLLSGLLKETQTLAFCAPISAVVPSRFCGPPGMSVSLDDCEPFCYHAIFYEKCWFAISGIVEFGYDHELRHNRLFRFMDRGE